MDESKHAYTEKCANNCKRAHQELIDNSSLGVPSTRPGTLKGSSSVHIYTPTANIATSKDQLTSLPN